MHKWLRLPALHAAGTNTSDTTEVQIGTGLTVPNWAQSIRALAAHLVLLAATTTETVAGYIRLTNDNNTIDPMNFPLPLVTFLSGAIGPHNVLDHITCPAIHDVTPNDIVHAYTALDAATTGVHTIQAYILFSSHKAPFNVQAQKSAVIAGSQTANTEAGSATLETIANKVSAILGIWNYMYAYPTAAQTCGGYVKVASAAEGWQEQLIPTNMIPSGLSTQVTPITRPLFCATEEILKELSGYEKLPFPDPFPIKTREGFVFTNYMDGTNTVAPAGRYGLIWKE